MSTIDNTHQNMKSRILVLREQGRTYSQIAAEVGLSRSRVGQYVKQAETRKLIAALNAQKSGPHPE